MLTFGLDFLLVFMAGVLLGILLERRRRQPRSAERAEVRRRLLRDS